jgi:hypothetical protein
LELLLIYLWLKLDVVRGTLGVLCLLGGVGVLVLCMIASVESWEPGFKWARRIGWALPFAGALAVLVPSAKDVAVLVGASYAIDLARSPEGAKVASLLRGKANEILDEELRKLATKK